MLKQIIGSLAILVSVGLLLNGCEDKNPTFQDPCPADTCDPYGGIDKPQPDTSGGDGSDSTDGSDSSNSDSDEFGLALTVRAETSGGQNAPVRGNGVNVKIYNFDGSELLVTGNPEEDSGNECDNGEFSAYFNPEAGEYFEAKQYRVTVDTFDVVLNESNNDDTTTWYLNEKKIQPTKPSCDSTWNFSTENVDLKKVN